MLHVDMPIRLRRRRVYHRQAPFQPLDRGSGPAVSELLGVRAIRLRQSLVGTEVRMLRHVGGIAARRRLAADRLDRGIAFDALWSAPELLLARGMRLSADGPLGASAALPGDAAL